MRWQPHLREVGGWRGISEEDPRWVARFSSGKPAPAVGQSPSIVPTASAPAGSVTPVQADGADKPPIEEAVIPQRLEPSLPEQPTTTKTTVVEPGQQHSTTEQQPSTTEQPSHRPNISVGRRPPAGGLFGGDWPWSSGGALHGLASFPRGRGA